MKTNLRLYPLNPAEAIFAPFHDPLLAGLIPSSFESRHAANARVLPFWCWTVVTWDDCDPRLMAGILEIRQSLPRRPYDRIICCLTVPSGVTVEVQLLNGQGTWTLAGEPWTGDNQRQEVNVPLPAEEQHGIRLVFGATEPGPKSIGLAWLGVQNSTLCAEIQKQRCRLDPAWDGWIRPPDEWKLDEPHCGLLFAGGHWEELRSKRKLSAWKPTWELLRERATNALKYTPEEAVTDFLPWQDERYLRARERGRPALYLDGPVLALVGIVERDLTMVRHAVRCLLAIIHARSWACSEECRLPGSSWDIRCFLEEMYSTAAALMFDWLASTLTDRARELFATKLWDNGMAVIERDLAKFEQVHHINQGPWFGRGRVLGGLLLETLWPRMGKYADRACDDLRQDLSSYILPDGGVDEGPMYLALTLEVTLVPIIAYARRRNLSAKELLPEAIGKVGNYFGALACGRPGRFVPDGDCANDEIVADSIAVLAGLYPDGRFNDLFAVSLPKKRPFSYIQHYGGTGLFAFILGPREVPPSHRLGFGSRVLEHTGIASGRIQANGTSLRWQLNGSKANPHHAHRDKGALLIELDDEPLFVDRGVVRYEDPRVMAMKRADMHNVLVPTKDGVNALDQLVPTQAMIPIVSPDAHTTRVLIDLQAIWADSFRAYRRSFEAKDPSEWSVTDKGELLAVGRVTFHLHSPHPFVQSKGRVFATTGSQRVEIFAPWATHVLHTVDLIDCNYQPIHHLQIWSGHATRFDLVTTFRRVARESS